MDEKSKHLKSGKGFTLIEIMVAMVIVTIAALGTMGYQYYAVSQQRLANAEMNATRIGQLVLEDWKSAVIQGMGATYDPSALQMGVTKISTDRYSITVDSLPMRLYLQLSTVSGNLKQIKVTLSWRKDYLSGSTGSDDPSIVLVTYAMPAS